MNDQPYLSDLPKLIPSTEFSLIDQVQLIMSKGGIVMIPLAICSFIVILVVIERLFVLRYGRLAGNGFFKQWKEWLEAGMQPEQLPAQSSASIVTRVFSPLVRFLPLTQSRLEERFGDLVRKEKHRLERGLVFLDTIAGIAPLFGLLGTALGMIEVFARLSAGGEAKINSLSAGISEALFTTVAGLCIGIPSLIAYNLLSRRITQILITVEDQLNSLIDQYQSVLTK